MRSAVSWIFTALAACNGSGYRDGPLPGDHWQTRTGIATGGRIYLLGNGYPSRVVEIDPRIPGWRQIRMDRHLLLFDVGPDGFSWLRYDDSDLEWDGRALDCEYYGECRFTRRGLVVGIGPRLVRIYPRDGGPPFEAASLEGIEILAVDYARDRVWGWSGSRGLLSFGYGESEWRPARVVPKRNVPRHFPEEGLKSIRFGRGRFAFIAGGLLCFGEPDCESLILRGALDLGWPPFGFHFNARDSDVVIVGVRDRIWAWDLVSGRGRILRRRADYDRGLYYDAGTDRLFTIRGGRVGEAAP